MSQIKTKLIVTLVIVVGVLVTALVFPAPVQAEEASLTENLQAMVAQLTMKQQAALFLLLSELTGAAAAASLSPEQAVTAVLEAYGEAARVEDLDAMMSHVSDDFKHWEYGDKEGLKRFMSEAMSMGYLDNLSISYEDAEFDLEGDTMTVYPIDIEGAFGTATMEYVLKKVGETWKIVELDIEGV